jgi:exodeoxyribonuclease-5
MLLEREGGTRDTVHLPSDYNQHKAVLDRITDEARDGEQNRWDELRAFRSAMADLQHIYALTVHKSQGSTFGVAFIDVRDIRKREAHNLLETQQLCYTALTRPSDVAVLVNT